MLVFVTSLRHPDDSVSYSQVEALLQRTLKSVTAQSNDEFVVLVVGNQRPRFDLPAQVRFVLVDFPSPAQQGRDSHLSLTDVVWDKGTKLSIGLIVAREYRPDHVMIFDADDYVSHRLAALSHEHPESPGWVMDRGYIYSERRNTYRPVNRFNKRCGTSHILNYDLFEVPDYLDASTSQLEIAEAFGERMTTIIGAHYNVYEWLAARGHLLKPLPFRGAVYTVDTGENHSRTPFQGLALPVSRNLVIEFGVSPPSSMMQAMASAFGPRAVFNTVRSRVLEIAKRISKVPNG